MPDFESDGFHCSKLLESDFELSTIRFGMADHQSLPYSLYLVVQFHDIFGGKLIFFDRVQSHSMLVNSHFKHILCNNTYKGCFGCGGLCIIIETKTKT